MKKYVSFFLALMMLMGLSSCFSFLSTTTTTTTTIPGGYEGKFAVFYYSVETGEKAMVNTEIPVSITIQE